MQRRTGRGLGRMATAVLVAGGWLGALALAGAVPAGAVTTVTLFASPTGTGTTCSASTPCALTRAATDAHGDTDEAVTVHLMAGTYSDALLDYTIGAFASVAFVGAGTTGSSATILDGGSVQRIFRDAATPPVSFTSVAFEHGAAGFAGCILDGGTLTLTHVLLAQCTATSGSGGAIQVFGRLHLTTSSVATSSATGSGGGLSVMSARAVLTNDAFVTDDSTGGSTGGGGLSDDSGTVTVSGSTFHHDRAVGDGGGIRANDDGTLTLTTSSFTTDTADQGGGLSDTNGFVEVDHSTFSVDTAGTGGALVEKTAGATLYLIRSTVDHDSATFGGGIDAFTGRLTVAGSTFIQDTAGDEGGGVDLETDVTATLTNDTFEADAASSGGGIHITSIAHLTLLDDTLADDTSANGPGLYVTTVMTDPVTVSNSIFDHAGCASGHGRTPTDGGHNVASTHSCGFGSNSISTSVTIGLQPLAANTSSGPMTMAVTPTSSAFEEVPSANCTNNVDERGFPRPGAVGKNCDAGAYEYQLTGYDMVGSDGGVFVFNPPGVSTKGFFGSLPGIHVVPNKPVVGIVPTVTDTGYFLVASDGGVFSFGTAPFLGSLPGLKVTPNLPIVGIVAADTDAGYFLVGADGGVYAFGTVPFLGSLPGTHIAVSDIIGIAATPSGDGYWVVAATGKVYAFGTAKAFTTSPTTSPVTAIAGTPTGGGYWLVTKEGGVFPYGNAKKEGQGTLPAIHVTPSQPVIGIVRVAATVGYWLIGSDGGIFAFGTAPFVGSLPGVGVHVSNIVGAVPN